MAQKSYPTQGKGRRPIIGYDNKKFRANYDSIFKNNDKQLEYKNKLTNVTKSNPVTIVNRKEQ